MLFCVVDLEVGKAVIVSICFAFAVAWMLE